MSENESTIVPTSGMDFDTQVLIVRAYVVLSEYGRTPVHYRKVVETLDLARSQVSGVNSFFVGMGFLKQTEKGAYLPSDDAIAFFSQQPGEEDFSKLVPALRASRLYKLIESLVMIRGSLSKDNVIAEILRVSGTSVSTRAERALEWLEKANMIDIDGDDNVTVT